MLGMSISYLMFVEVKVTYDSVEKNVCKYGNASSFMDVTVHCIQMTSRILLFLVIPMSAWDKSL